MSQYNGEYGGRVLKAFKGDGVAFVKGATLTPEMVMHWPLANRMALHTIDKVEWFDPLGVDESAVRSTVIPVEPAAAPAKKRGGRRTT